MLLRIQTGKNLIKIHNYNYENMIKILDFIIFTNKSLYKK